MISKELLSEVLGIHTILMNPIIEPENKIGYLVYGSQNTLEEVRRNHKQINIYEFAFKCKEWALRKNYILASESNTYGGICNMSISSMDVDVFYNIQSITRANTEVEAIFKACQWILDNKGK